MQTKSFFGYVVALTAGVLATTAAPTRHEFLAERVLVASKSTDVRDFGKANSSAWAFASAWQLPQGKAHLSVCSTEPSRSVVFAIFQLQPLDQVTVAAAIRNATRAANTFSSKLVPRETVQEGDEIAFETGQTKLYRVAIDDDDADESGQSCVEAAMAVPASGLYLIVATEPASSAAFTIRTKHGGIGVLVAAPVMQCFLGCAGDADDTDRNKIKGTVEAHSVRETSGVTSAICASLLVSLTSLGGVVVLRVYTKSSQLVEYMTTFAAGCLLGVVVFHLLPESSEKLSEDGGDASPEWLPGAYTLLGMLLSLAIEVQVHVWLGGGDDEPCLETGASHHHGHGHSHGHRHKRLPDAQDLLAPTPSASSTSVDSRATLSPSPTPTEKHEGPATMFEHADQVDIVVEAAMPPHSQDTHGDIHHIHPTTNWLRAIQPIAWMTAIGDFCHAFTDGVVLAVAFQSCSASLGWAVALGIVLHEVPHRIGDFFVFLRAGMTLPQALVVNMLASGGSLAGVLAIFSLGDVSETALGAMLAIGAGSLLFIALAELLPPVLGLHDQKAALCHLAWLTFGCALIWLSALREVECEA